jgi:hypothetical protein
MPAHRDPSRDEPFPVRGTVGGFHDPWDDPADETAALRARAEANDDQQTQRAEEIARDLRAEQADKAARPRPGRPRERGEGG